MIDRRDRFYEICYEKSKDFSVDEVLPDKNGSFYNVDAAEEIRKIC